MAYFAARDMAPADTCIAKVAEAQVYVGIIGHRYGASVRGRPDLSYTELEFETASRMGLPRLIFVVRDASPSMAIETAEFAERQEAFRRRLLDEAGLTVAWVTSPTELEVALLHALVELNTGSEATAVATRTLPRDAASFTGREAEMDQLSAMVSEANHGGVVAISAIDGMAGVGKTAFAIHVAHQLAREFPDGQLFLDLHGHTAGQLPVAPGEALGSLLLTLGIGPQAIPAEVDRRAAMWRARLAGKRMLILLDDAASHEQVRPLLPGAPGCLVLITSRRRLAALEDVQPLTVSTLPPAQALELFIRLLGARARYAEPAAVAELVEMCGYLPLAIGLLAARLRSHPSWSVSSLANRLKNAQDRLDEMQVENRAVEAVFNLSYQDLSADRQRLFRRLGLHPGQEIDAFAAVALDAIDLTQAHRELEALYHDHILDELLPGRYRMHDLIRVYARLLAAHDDPDSNDAAIRRLLDYYQYAAVVANKQVALRSDSITPSVGYRPIQLPDLSTREKAVAWITEERSNLRAIVDYAVTLARHDAVFHLSHAMHSLLRVTGHWDQAIAIHQSALAAARHMGSGIHEAYAYADLGSAQYEYATAIALLTEATTLFGKAGERLGQANAMSDLGVVQYRCGQYTSATTNLDESLKLFRQIEDHLGQANSLNGLGAVKTLTGEYVAATASITEALALYRDIGDRGGEANALNNLGRVQYYTGQHESAIRSIAAALTLFRQISDPPGSANALNNLGVVQYTMGEYSAAEQSLAEALSISRDLGSPYFQSGFLNNLGRAQYLNGDVVAATDSLAKAGVLYHELGDPLGQANVLSNLGMVQHLTDQSAAVDSLIEALAMFQRLGDRRGQAETLNRLGVILCESSDSDEALRRHRLALRLARDIRTPLEEARALDGIGRCLLCADNILAGAAHLRQALAIYERLRVPEADRVKATLIGVDGRQAKES
jgi:tetratricopeptide (TPR) repeat protein